MDNPIQALVLNRSRYGESSLILRLFTERYGIIGGVQKGASNKKNWVPEVGDIIEVQPIRKRSEGLYTLTKVEYQHHYRYSKSLEKSAIRDTSFELIMAILHEEAPQPEIYEITGKFLHYLETCSNDEALFSLWLLVVRFSEAFGFPIEHKFCSSCGEILDNGGEPSPESGGFTCPSCRKGRAPLFSGEILSLISTGKPSANELFPTLGSRDKMGVLTYLIEYLRAHLEFHREIHSLAFLSEVL